MHRLENIEDLKVGAYFVYRHHLQLNFDKITDIDINSTDMLGYIKVETKHRILLNTGVATIEGNCNVFINKLPMLDTKVIYILNDDDAKFFVDMFAKIDAVNAIRDNTIKTIEQSLKEKFDNVNQS